VGAKEQRSEIRAVEGIGSEPGTVEVIDLQSLKTAATVDVPQQAVGIDFWKVQSHSVGSR
jgi:hypothetical protein